MNLERIIQFIAELIKTKFTGRIIIDMHDGNVSKKVKREVVETIE